MATSRLSALVAAASALAIAGCGVVGDTSPQPTDFPQAPQSLVFDGDITANVLVGRPTSCGWGTGPSGPEFGYGLYFQANGQWQHFSVSTDAKVQPYTGPGVYHPHAWLSTFEEMGSSGTDYSGDVTLTVTNDAMPDSGTVDGQLRNDKRHVVTVTGGWTCQWGPLLGPG